MKQQTLDDGLSMRRKHPSFLNWLSIYLLWAGLVFYFVRVPVFDIQVLASVALLAASTTVTYFNYSLGVRITLGVILLGIFNILTFSPIKFSIGFGAKHRAVTASSRLCLNFCRSANPLQVTHSATP